MAELSLDDHDRDSFAGHLDRVGVAELVRREPAPDAGRPGGVSQLRAHAGGEAEAAAGWSAEYAKQCAERRPGPDLQPRIELLPRASVHSDLAPLAPLPAAHEHSAARFVTDGMRSRRSCAPLVEHQALAAQTGSLVGAVGASGSSACELWRFSPAGEPRVLAAKPRHWPAP